MSEVVPGVGADDPARTSDASGAEPGQDPEYLRLQSELTTRESAHAGAQRLANDAKVVRLLAAEEFSGPRTERWTKDMLGKGWLTVLKMTESGEIFAKARQLGRPVPEYMVTDAWTAEDRYSITTDSVEKGMRVFHSHALVRGGWRPEGGASLYTYFVGASIRSFRDTYVHWFRAWMRGQAELGMDSDERAALIPDQRTADPAVIAATRDQVDRVLQLIQDPQLHEGLVLRSVGYSQAEAAQRVGLSEKSLERRLGRARTKIKQAQAGSADDQEGGFVR